MTSTDIATVFDSTAPRASDQPVSPTDISQFIRLDQCQRYLRLQLHMRQSGEAFMRDYDVALQTIPPILTRSGARFEEVVEADISARRPTTRFTDELRKARRETSDNSMVIQHVRAIAPGDTHVLLQPRLDASVAGWRIRGDVDVLRLERDVEGNLHCLIADLKSSTSSKVEHRLQVAIYHQMLESLLAESGVAHSEIELAILYRGPVEGTVAADEADPKLHLLQREAAINLFGTEQGFLEHIEDAYAYIGSVRDLLTGPKSVAERVLNEDFDAIPYHLTYKCDGCRFNEFCMKRSAETDDLSLLPHMPEQAKSNLRQAGFTTIVQLAELKERVKDVKGRGDKLVPAPGKERECRELAATWSVGQHLDEIIHRAHGYVAWKNSGWPELRNIPHKGYGTLPYNDAELHPNLVRVYIDAQHDYLYDRIYMLGARIVASNNGKDDPERQRNVVHITSGPPASNEIEEALFIDWVNATIKAVTEFAAPDADGNPNAPIHLVFVNGFAQRQLLNGLGRYQDTILGMTALYDFMTQLAMYDSPIASFLDQEISEQKNYPMVCQSLQAVAAYLRFDWNQDVPYRTIFRARMFDWWKKFDETPDTTENIPGIGGWFTGRARFNSQIPLEYAYAAWGEIIPGEDDGSLQYYAKATPDLLTGFHGRRLEAMEHIAKDFFGNRQTMLSSFALPDLGTFQQKATSLAQALDEFVSIERFVDLAAWKHSRLAPPEQRVLNGESLVVRYLEEDQDPEIAEQNRENQRRNALREEYRAAYRERNPHVKSIRLPKEQNEACKWNQTGMQFRLRIETADLACDLESALNISTLKPGSRMVLNTRWSMDTRLPENEQTPFTSTAKQLLYGTRVELKRVQIEPGPDGRAASAFAVVEMTGGGGSDKRGFLFGARNEILIAETLYTLDSDPNDINGFWAAKITEGLVADGENMLYAWLSNEGSSTPIEPSEQAAQAQQRFMDGMDALRQVGLMHTFEPSKHAFIGQHGDDPVLLVQGPPGTGKSFSTAYALLARIQGAMAAGRSYRVFLSCTTNAATDVLLLKVLEAQETLRHLFEIHPDIMARYFDPRLGTVPLFRQRPRTAFPDGINPLSREMKPKDVIAEIIGESWSVTASTPGGIYNMVKDAPFNQKFIDCVVLDEASQMNIPQAIMATLPLHLNGRLIVVGDHRQMPPIISHDWANEARRSFQDFKSYESLFVALLKMEPPKINFEESFRLHADLAEFLCKEIYRQDSINYHSNLHHVLGDVAIEDDFVAAVLTPEHPLTVVVHDEKDSQHRNVFEQNLITPILKALADETLLGLTPEDGLGVVVPHRAQRAALQEVPELSRRDPETGEVVVSAVDTVERFQGDERTLIMISATESDPEYLLATGDFLLDPRRLTVALSRAKQKMVLVASRSIFELFSADEETFQNAQLWKNLLKGTCTVRLWKGVRDGHEVEVWGNAPSSR